MMACQPSLAIHLSMVYKKKSFLAGLSVVCRPHYQEVPCLSLAAGDFMKGSHKVGKGGIKHTADLDSRYENSALLTNQNQYIKYM